MSSAAYDAACGVRLCRDEHAKTVPRYSIAAPQRSLSDKPQGPGRRGEIGDVTPMSEVALGLQWRFSNRGVDIFHVGEQARRLPERQPPFPHPSTVISGQGCHRLLSRSAPRAHTHDPASSADGGGRSCPCIRADRLDAQACSDLLGCVMSGICSSSASRCRSSSGSPASRCVGRAPRTSAPDRLH